MDSNNSKSYSSPIAFAYIFNLIVGVGALALPKAFNEAGLLLGSGLLVVLCVVSYINATYIVEAMSAANAYHKMKERRKKMNTSVQSKTTSSRTSSLNEDSIDKKFPITTGTSCYCVDVSGVHNPATKEEDVNITETTYLLQPASDSDMDYEITTKYELGVMASLFYPTLGVILYYICICLYLFGDLAIYAVTAPASLTRVFCYLALYYGDQSNDSFINETYELLDKENGPYEGDHCIGDISKIQVYYIFLALFLLCIGPFTFFNMTKTMILQVITTMMRYLAFLFMISLAIVRISSGQHNLPKLANISAFPGLFGISIYAFMCQHSLPGIVTPMSSKKYIYSILLGDFGLIIVFYFLLVYTGVFAFGVDDMSPLYTLDFFHPGDPIYKLIIGTYLALFPVFTLSASFPIISVTLRDNLKALVKTALQKLKGKDYKFPFVVDRIVFPIVTLAFPTIIAFATQQVDILVSITGSFPGVGVQYIIPASLVLMARWTMQKQFGKYENRYKSPFSRIIVVSIVVFWSLISVILMIVDLSLSPPKKSDIF